MSDYKYGYHIFDKDFNLMDGRVQPPGVKLEAQFVSTDNNKGLLWLMKLFKRFIKPKVCAYGMHATYTIEQSLMEWVTGDSYWLACCKIYPPYDMYNDKFCGLAREIEWVVSLDDLCKHFGYASKLSLWLVNTKELNEAVYELRTAANQV